jgi:hypothetical protein
VVRDGDGWIVIAGEGKYLHFEMQSVTKP